MSGFENSTPTNKAKGLDQLETLLAENKPNGHDESGMVINVEKPQEEVSDEVPSFVSVKPEPDVPAEPEVAEEDVEIIAETPTSEPNWQELLTTIDGQEKAVANVEDLRSNLLIQVIATFGSEEAGKHIFKAVKDDIKSFNRELERLTATPAEQRRSDSVEALRVARKYMRIVNIMQKLTDAMEAGLIKPKPAETKITKSVQEPKAEVVPKIVSEPIMAKSQLAESSSPSPEISETESVTKKLTAEEVEKILYQRVHESGNKDLQAIYNGELGKFFTPERDSGDYKEIFAALRNAINDVLTKEIPEGARQRISGGIFSSQVFSVVSQYIDSRKALYSARRKASADEAQTELVEAEASLQKSKEDVLEKMQLALHAAAEKQPRQSQSVRRSRVETPVTGKAGKIESNQATRSEQVEKPETPTVDPLTELDNLLSD